jgi:hypothetical protein
MAEIESKPRPGAWFDGAGGDLASNQAPAGKKPCNVKPPKEPPAQNQAPAPDPLADLIRHAATDLAAPPRYSSTADVACIFGDPLARIIWQGQQWAVTDYGLQCRDGGYSITRFRLWENESALHGWIRHMARKPWVDVQDFAEGLRIARGRHAKSASAAR